MLVLEEFGKKGIMGSLLEEEPSEIILLLMKLYYGIKVEL